MLTAPIAYVLFNEGLRYNPARPARDRFVLSGGHASMLLYSMLHLTGVKQSNRDGQPTDEPAVLLEQICQFRQLHSRCPGHPELGHASGVETTTGPLGWGGRRQRWHGDRVSPAGGPSSCPCGRPSREEGLCTRHSGAGQKRNWILDDRSATVWEDA